MDNPRPCRVRALAPSLITLTLLGAAAGAHAADQELLDILLANGAITAEQHASLLAKEKLTREDVDSVVVQLNNKGFSVASSDGANEIRIGTRLHADASMHHGNTGSADPIDGTEIRRARLEMKGRFERDWAWAAEADFADNSVAVKDFWLGYDGIEGMRIAAGHQKQPYSLAVEMSSNDIPFIERSIDNDLVIPFTDRAMGIRVDTSGEHWFFAGGVFGESVEPNVRDDESWGAVARLVVAPVISKDKVLHLGIRAAYREPDGAGTVRLRDESTHMSNLRIVDTGALGAVDSVTLYGPEAAVAWGPFSILGEYNQAEIARDGASDLSFSSWHVEASWVLTGESRAAAYRIDSGEFKRVTGDNNFSLRDGTWGAMELAMRYATIDLNDAGFVGGKESALTAALNWYLNRSVRLMFDYTHVLDTDGSTAVRAAAEGLDVFQLRVQYTY
ncbi:MAG: porin [Pseudomonadales bacterium]|nr:porin [Pseudomonadales bacterium]MCP5184968.1 porin [Pseudomonadales bacterium]